MSALVTCRDCYVSMAKGVTLCEKHSAMALALDGLDPEALKGLIEAAQAVQSRICGAKCMPHEILSTSHHTDCQDLRRALQRLGVTK